jgi:hypothetical protein
LLLAATAVLAFTLEWEDESVGLIDWIILAMCPAIVAYMLYTVRVGLRV